MLHWETVSPELKEILYIIASNPHFRPFRLCGGTALALQLGHRSSVDADYVSQESFDKEHLMGICATEIPFVSDMFAGELGVFLKSNSVKLDFLSWNIPFIRGEVNKELRIADIEEIAAMKLFAITRRGEKKDYYDVAVLLRKYRLEELLKFYNERHPKNDTAIMARFLVTFGDVDFQPDPHILIDFTWQDAKALLQNKVREYLSTNSV